MRQTVELAAGVVVLVAAFVAFVAWPSTIIAVLVMAPIVGLSALILALALALPVMIAADAVLAVWPAVRRWFRLHLRPGLARWLHLRPDSPCDREHGAHFTDRP